MANAEGRAPNLDGRIPGLDGLRSLAIGLVVAMHVHLQTGWRLDQMGPLRSLVPIGWVGVDLFFALSGFLITTLLLREEAAHAAAGLPPRFSLARFYGRRALRILPIFFAVFLVNALVLARLPVFGTARLDRIPEGERVSTLLPFATIGRFCPLAR